MSQPQHNNEGYLIFWSLLFDYLGSVFFDLVYPKMYELRIADCGLRIADCGLRVADYGLRVADYGLWIADCFSVSYICQG
jgi:hypothetical protein